METCCLQRHTRERSPVTAELKKHVYECQEHKSLLYNFLPQMIIQNHATKNGIAF